MKFIFKWLRRGVMAIGVLTIIVVLLAVVFGSDNDEPQEASQPSETATVVEVPTEAEHKRQEQEEMAKEKRAREKAEEAERKRQREEAARLEAEERAKEAERQRQKEEAARLAAEKAERKRLEAEKAQREAEAERLKPKFQIVGEKDHSFGNIRSRVTLEIVSSGTDGGRPEILAMMTAGVERHRRTWPDAVSVRLWDSSEMNPPIKNSIVFAPDGCGWAGDDCSQPLWTELMSGVIPSDLLAKGRPDDEEKEAAINIICRQSLQCWGDKHSLAAIFKCQPQIEAYARYDYEWTDGFFGAKLQRFRWKDRKAGTLSYTGNKVKFQNGFGAWQRITYWCHYDPNADTATVSVHE